MEAGLKTGRCAKSRCYPRDARVCEPTDQNGSPGPVAAALRHGGAGTQNETARPGRRVAGLSSQGGDSDLAAAAQAAPRSGPDPGSSASVSSRNPAADPQADLVCGLPALRPPPGRVVAGMGAGLRGGSWTSGCRPAPKSVGSQCAHAGSVVGSVAGVLAPPGWQPAGQFVASEHSHSRGMDRGRPRLAGAGHGGVVWRGAG